MGTKIAQIKLPEEVNKILRSIAIMEGMTLRDYCVKVLCKHAQDKQVK